MCRHIFDDFHRSDFCWHENISIKHFIEAAVCNVLQYCTYMAILTAFRINILALLNSRFTTHAFAVCRSTSMAILDSKEKGRQKNGLN